MHATPQPDFLKRPDFEPTIPYILAAAAEYLLTFGWTRTNSWNPGSSRFAPATALGAIAEVCWDFAITEPYPNVFAIDEIDASRWYHDVVDYLNAYISVHTDADCISHWNDDQRRTADEVIGHLLLAAETRRTWVIRRLGSTAT